MTFHAVVRAGEDEHALVAVALARVMGSRALGQVVFAHSETRVHRRHALGEGPALVAAKTVGAGGRGCQSHDSEKQDSCHGAAGEPHDYVKRGDP